MGMARMAHGKEQSDPTVENVYKDPLLSLLWEYLLD